VGISAGLGEEILFRGLIQPVFGVLATSALFALIHLHYGPTPLLLELFLIGIVLGLVRQRWNTTAAIWVHGGFDFFALISPLLHH
jgi:membrane protease YdiL (CAAX protease family)